MPKLLKKPQLRRKNSFTLPKYKERSGTETFAGLKKLLDTGSFIL